MTDEIVFLFGAGASKGAGHIDPSEPSLGPHLYECLAEAYPDQWGDRSVMRVFRDGLRENFEKTMFDVICVRHPSIHTLRPQTRSVKFDDQIQNVHLPKELAFQDRVPTENQNPVPCVRAVV
jgi:hypothetical protein